MRNSSQFGRIWKVPGLSGGPNPTVTLHNVGSLLAGLFQVAGAHCTLREIMVVQKTNNRVKNSYIVYAFIVLGISIVGFLAFKSYLPLFFNQATGPTFLRQIVLGGAICLFALAGYPKLKCLYMSGYTADVIAHHGVLDEISTGLI